MRFQVPQFIEVEDKIFGPLTLKQFIYLAGGAGLSVVCYLLLPIYIAILLIIPIICFSAALAFYKVNNKPFIDFLEAMVMYALHPRLYIWNQEEKVVTQKNNEVKVAPDSGIFIPKLSDSKLKELTWNLDTKNSLNSQDTSK